MPSTGLLYGALVFLRVLVVTDAHEKDVPLFFDHILYDTHLLFSAKLFGGFENYAYLCIAFYKR